MAHNRMHAKLAKLKKDCPESYWGKRILAQLEYANRVSLAEDHKFDVLIEEAADYLGRRLKADGAIGQSAVSEAEQMLAGIAAEAKSYELICAAHAHIDMNFLWGWDETVSATLNTFRTMLDLLKEYPDFIFSQSQAAAYQIVEKYDPEMLEEIQASVREGRWEVTASTWVEADKNMPNGESMVRQFLYAKQYLAGLFNLDPGSLQIDFEPDTFGHGANVPETLYHAGVKYYYYCRGHNNEGHHLYRWVAPSGRSVIAYKEPHWYDSRIEPEMVLTVPAFCKQTGMKSMMKVYGVGDHGGGPTRRDIERVLDMQTWPIFPSIRFGKYADYFALTDQVADQLPVVSNELNFIFTGCYSSEARLKKANRVSENLLNEAEAFSSAASLWASAPYYGKDLEDAWRKTLFNQFHDILPGTGIPETRDHALGMSQEIAAMANTKRSAALRKLASRIDTSAYAVDNENIKDSISEGAGAGVGVMHLSRTGESDRGRGKTRIFHLFNSASAERKEIIELILWDWNGDLRNIVFQDDEGQQVDYQFVDRGFEEHWGHFFLRVLLPVTVPAMGYATYVMTEKDGDMGVLAADDYYLTGQNLPPEETYSFVLENEHVRAVLDTQRLTLVSLVDKTDGTELLDQGGSGALFRLIEEDSHQGGGNAWLVGRYRKVESLIEGVHVERIDLGPDRLRQSIMFSMSFRSSKLKVTVSLDRGSRRLDFAAECDWHEYGKNHAFTPQLQFILPLSYECERYKYDTAFGTIERAAMELDVPANSWATGLPRQEMGADKKAVTLVTDSKYGFRGTGHSLAVTLLRGSYSPDPYPDTGIQRFTMGVCIGDPCDNQALIEQAYNYNHPMIPISVAAGPGEWPARQSFFRLDEGTAAVSAIKMPEDGVLPKRWIVRVYETAGRETQVALSLFRSIRAAYFVDTLERSTNEGVVDILDSQLRFSLPANQVASLCIEFH
ncbi:alpha-mannosidase [Paenibacillus mendelii]|uniref:Alpha-mannosidase n=1 Tax=Paenibacillus mendelii TaxID=206163 RepID=A0ABV6JB64_9BACL|nr:alpha-mannosidase [Paenibacillus mendelii]MCQ6559464.1 alpha-mannosidase [Paenibacillus mendelii]